MAFATPIIQFHHTLGILSIVVKYWLDMKPEDDLHILNGLYKTEISTFFYVFQLWIPKTAMILYWSNAVIFSTTFFKFRIYDYYKNIITSPMHYELMEKYIADSWAKAAALHTSVYGLYALNMYWFIAICKRAYKYSIRTLVSVKQALFIEHYSTTYIQFANMFATCYVYSSSPNESNIFDAFGTAILSATSCQYHSTALKHYRLFDKIDYASPEMFESFMIHQFAIHLKSFLCAASAIYYVTDYRPIILFSAGLHACSYFAAAQTAHRVKNENTEIVQYPPSEMYLNLVLLMNVTNFVAGLFDIMIVIAHSSDPFASIHLLNSTYVYWLLITMTPFYNLNPVAIQICMMAQNLYLGRCNLRYEEDSNRVMQIIVQ
jgi:hypothetical protein